jgi:hypothetical protein
MGMLKQLVDSALGTAKSILNADLPLITWEQCTGPETEDEKKAGTRTYASPLSYKVVINKKTRFVKAEDGVMAADISSIQFLDSVEVTTRDRITMPDGSQPQIMAVEGAKDAAGKFYAPTVLF